MSRDPDHGDDVARTDDLTQIPGIGEQTAERLDAIGIRTYAELAASSADDIVTRLPDVSGLSSTRIEDWREQARNLATGATTGQSVPQDEPVVLGDGQRYESFMVRLLLNRDGSVRMTTVRHIGTGAKRQWPGLERDALPSYMVAVAASAGSPTEALEEPRSDGADQPATQTTAMPHTEEVQSVTTLSERTATHRALVAASAGLAVERAVLSAAEPFTMTMTIEFTEPPLGADRLAYSAVVTAKPLAGGPKCTVARADGLLATTSPTISIAAGGLSAGAYRLDGAVSLRQPGDDRPAVLAGIAEGLLVHVLPG